MENRIHRIEKICIIGIIALAGIIAAGTAKLWRTPADVPQEEASEKLTEWADFLPDSIFYGQKLPVTRFRTAGGTVRSLADRAGKKRILMFWGSWCPYCDEALAHCAEFEAVLREHPDWEFILIDKLDADRGETVEKAQQYLTDNAIPFECLYDENLAAYSAYGLKRIPTLLALDERGYLRYMTVTALRSGAELEDILDYVDSGGSAATRRFLRANMTGADGGAYTTFLDNGGGSPTGRDVLSESQGILMECAVLTRDAELFESSWNFARERLYRDGVFAWYVTADGRQADANALIDDLRIYRALKAADALWGGYGAELTALAEAIREHNVHRGHLAGFYDFQQRRAGTELPLFYIDAEALRDLAEADADFAGAAQEAIDILRGGYIGDDFPLYYPAYDHAAGRYSADSMNTSEALITLWHAVRSGVARPQSIQWLERQAASGTLAARYRTDGQAVRGFDYDSTAVYAIAALIGAEAGNARLYTCARNRMEKYRVADRTPLHGSFSDRTDGSDIIAFDQLMPLLVYAVGRDITFAD